MLRIVFGGGRSGGIGSDVGFRRRNLGVRVKRGFGGGLETLEFSLLVGGETRGGGAALEEGGGVASHGGGGGLGEAGEGPGEGEETAGHFACLSSGDGFGGAVGDCDGVEVGCAGGGTGYDLGVVDLYFGGRLLV